MQDDAPPPGQPLGGNNPDDPAAPQLRARVPDHVSRGVFSTGVIVMTRPTEVILDFLQTIGRPQRIAVRVVLPHLVLPQFVDALQKNIDIYTGRFGAPVCPKPTPNAEGNAEQKKPTPQEIYDDLQIPDEMLSGVYANGVMIGHGATEFSFDFLTSFFPQSAVSARVYLASGQIPRLLESLQGAAKNLQQPPPDSPPDTNRE